MALSVQIGAVELAKPVLPKDVTNVALSDQSLMQSETTTAGTSFWLLWIELRSWLVTLTRHEYSDTGVNSVSVSKVTSIEEFPATVP